MVDVGYQISAVSRRLGSRVLDAREARVLTVSQTYDAELADLWDACTNPERLPRWYLPVSGELRLGGRYQLEGNAHGTVERCDPPKSFAATWEFGGEVSWIEVRLSPAGHERTLFELEHVAHVDDEKWAGFGPGMVGIGWDLALLGLVRHFSAERPPDPTAWMSSAEGRDFVKASSDSWREADVAAGTDRATAQAGADRVAAMYLAPQPE